MTITANNLRHEFRKLREAYFRAIDALRSALASAHSPCLVGTADAGRHAAADRALTAGLAAKSIVSEVTMISIRKLAAVDMAWLGTRVIVSEYAIGVVLPLVLGWLSIRASLVGPVLVGWEAVLGVWLVTIALNYMPLFIYAVLIAKAGTAKEEGQPEFTHARRYGVQQAIILVPFLVVVLAFLQELLLT